MTQPATPETVRGTARDLVDGIYKLDKRLLLVLNVSRTVHLGSVDPTIPNGGR